MAQLEDNMAASEIQLSEDQMNRLDEVSAPVVSFSSVLAMPMIRRMVFGGHAVTGWAE